MTNIITEQFTSWKCFGIYQLDLMFSSPLVAKN